MHVSDLGSEPERGRVSPLRLVVLVEVPCSAESLLYNLCLEGIGARSASALGRLYENRPGEPGSRTLLRNQLRMLVSKLQVCELLPIDWVRRCQP